MEPEIAAPADPIVSAPEAAPAASTPAPAPATPAAAPEAPKAPVERRDVLKAAMKASQEPAEGKSLRERMIERGVIRPAAESSRPRAPDGKFVPSTQKAAPQASGTPGSQTSTTARVEPAAQPPVEDIPLPKSLRKELEPLWKVASPELRKAIIQREADYDKGVAQYRTRAQEAEALFNEFKPYEQVMRMTGANPVSAIRNMMPTMAVLATGSPQEKAFVMAKAMQAYNVPLEHIAQVMQGGVNAVQGGAQGAGADPLVQQLAAQVQQLTQAWTQNQQSTQQREDQRLASITEAFGRDKPNFEALRPQMWSLIQAQSIAEQRGVAGPLGAAGQTAAWSEQQWVENAYNAALRLNPDFYQSELTRQREEAARLEREKATQAAQASRAAAVQVRGAPAPAALGAQVNPQDRRAVIASAMRGVRT